MKIKASDRVAVAVAQKLAELFRAGYVSSWNYRQSSTSVYREILEGNPYHFDYEETLVKVVRVATDGGMIVDLTLVGYHDVDVNQDSVGGWEVVRAEFLARCHDDHRELVFNRGAIQVVEKGYRNHTPMQFREWMDTKAGIVKLFPSISILPGEASSYPKFGYRVRQLRNRLAQERGWIKCKKCGTPDPSVSTEGPICNYCSYEILWEHGYV